MNGTGVCLHHCVFFGQDWWLKLNQGSLIQRGLSKGSLHVCTTPGTRNGPESGLCQPAHNHTTSKPVSQGGSVQGEWKPWLDARSTCSQLCAMLPSL
mmetsp:Transcript_77302/g.129664  ORF Transcript_77302/g.129664 Transcript_77302/m.129664 type:complete len:97 (+) Transcript_77302:441-731(+)